MKKPMWKLFVLVGLMIVVMFGLMTVFSLMLGGMNPMASALKGLGMWGVMLLPLAGLLIMLTMMFFFFRSMTGSRGPMSAMMGRRHDPQLQNENNDLAVLTFDIPAVNCAHCKMTIEQAVGNLPGVASANVDVDAKQAVIQLISPPTRAEIEALLAEIGYPPQSQ